MPIINDNGRIVSDSFDIALYLDRAYPDGPALFGSDSAVAAGHFLQAWAFQALHSVIVRMVLKAIHGALADADAEYFRRSREARFGCRLEDYQSGIEANAAALAAALEPARRALAHHPWLAGPAPAFADYIVFGSLMWLTTIAGRLPLEQGDGVAVWFRRCLELHGGIGAKAKRAA